MATPPAVPLSVRIETFQSSLRLDLQPLWQGIRPDGSWDLALAHPWGQHHRPDWHQRGLIIWPRGGGSCVLRLDLVCPPAWRALAEQARARLVLRWWADAVALRVDGQPVHHGDLFDSACRWLLPERWWQGESLAVELQLRSPKHDDGALVSSGVELEPRDPADPAGLLQPTRAALLALQAALASNVEPVGEAAVQVLTHAHLDLAWLWPVADTWQAAERTFSSVLDLMDRFEELRFAHSTPALFAWLQTHRPVLFARLQQAVVAGRFEPINGPWVETDCVLISSASLLRQFQLGQQWSRQVFATLAHELAWLPDSFGFGAGLPAIARATGVRWFCTHKLAWNATNPFAHRLFRWRSRCGSEVLALMTAPIGTDADPVAIERYRLQWQQATGVAEALWLPGVGDHGGGPSAEMLEQLELWQVQARSGAALAPLRHGSLRDYLARLEPYRERLPIWRDELYLELHRGCATSRPDQKRHNRTLERLLREAEMARALVQLARPQMAAAQPPLPWPDLLFQQFHDILPGTSIPEVFEQAEPQWRAARRQARHARDLALRAWLEATPAAPAGGADGQPLLLQPWSVVQLQPQVSWRPCLRLPAGSWSAADGVPLASQPASVGGCWVQLPPLAGVASQTLQRRPATGALQPAAAALERPLAREALAEGRWRLSNGLLSVEVDDSGLQQLGDGAGRRYLGGPAALRRYRDAGEFWDAWDLAADYRDHPLAIDWEPQLHWIERGPLCTQVSWRGRCGRSRLRLDGRLLAGSPWFELLLSVDWQQQHEVLRLELPLAQPAVRWAADTTGGVLERPAQAQTPREQARWEVAAISWLASETTAPGGGLGVMLDGPQGVCASPEALGVSLLRAPTWPDPAADNGWQRLRMALLPCPQGWSAAAMPQLTQRWREPLWLRPLARGGAVPPVLPPLGGDLQLLGLRQGTDPGTAVISVQNLSPRRRRLELGGAWRVLARLDGLDQEIDHPAHDVAAQKSQDCTLAPWAVGFWLLAATQSS